MKLDDEVVAVKEWETWCASHPARGEARTASSSSSSVLRASAGTCATTWTISATGGLRIARRDNARGSRELTLACGDQQRRTCVDMRLRVRNRLADELRYLTDGSDVDRELKAGGSRDLEQRLDLWVLLTGL